MLQLSALTRQVASRCQCGSMSRTSTPRSPSSMPRMPGSRSDHPRAPLENAASRAVDRLNALFAEKSWDEIGALFADDIRLDDRRQGLRRESNDRANAMAEVRSIAELGTRNITTDTLAIRGERLVLSRVRFSGRGRRPDAFHTELLRIVEIDADERIVAVIDLDPDDLDAAFEELDARYRRRRSGTVHADTWSDRSWTTPASSTGASSRRPTPEWACVCTIIAEPVRARRLRIACDPKICWELVPDARYPRRRRCMGSMPSETVVTTSACERAQRARREEWQGHAAVRDGRSAKHVSRSELFDEDRSRRRAREFRRAQPAGAAAGKRGKPRWTSASRRCFAARDWDAMARNTGRRHFRTTIVDGW